MILTDSLVGKFLVATPYMADSRFIKSVLLICGQDDKGTVGFMINRYVSALSTKDLFSQLNITTSSQIGYTPLFFGGPVDMTRGFVLHSSDYQTPSTLNIIPEVCLTNTLDVLKAIAQNEGPQQYIITLGYTGWEKSQLEQEINENTWVIVDSDSVLIFDQDLDTKWERALNKLHIDPTCLSLSQGHA